MPFEGEHETSPGEITWRRSFPDSVRQDEHRAGKPGWANTTGETTSRRQAMARLIERWQELRRVTVRS
jgi:hypothetical protein